VERLKGKNHSGKIPRCVGERYARLGKY